MTRSNAIEPLEDCREFAGTEWASTDVLVTQDGELNGPCARWLKCVTVGGSLVVELERMPSGTTSRTLTIAVGESLPLRVRRIRQGTFAGKLQVGW